MFFVSVLWGKNVISLKVDFDHILKYFCPEMLLEIQDIWQLFWKGWGKSKSYKMC